MNRRPALIPLLVGLVVLAAPGRFFRASADLVASYAMNEANWSGAAPQVIDSSGNGHDGTAVGGANTVADSKFGRAGSFDGSGQYVTVGGTGSISGARSVVTWINLVANSLPTGLPILTGGTSSHGDFFGVSGANGIHTTSDYTPYSLYIDHWGSGGPSSTITITPGQWEQVAVTFDGSSTLDFYVNGRSAGQFSGSFFDYGINSYTAGGNTIGGTTTEGSFDGLMRGLQIYNTQLSAAQILTLYLGQPVPEPAGVTLLGVGLVGLGWASRSRPKGRAA